MTPDGQGPFETRERSNSAKVVKNGAIKVD